MDHLRPICFDICAGLFGWGSAFADAGYRVVGFDIENQFANFGKEMPENCELVLRDIRSLNGAELVREYGVPACIVASPPCQFFSYCAMPWSKAKKLMADVLASPERTAAATDLFNQCFRIQREVSEAAGHYVPMVVENVRGAQRWVGKARWFFGSFGLWGDVPALMPIPGKSQHGQKLPPGNATSPLWSERPISRLCDALKGEGHKTAGMNWSDRSIKGQDFTRIAGMQADGVKQASESGRRTDPGKGARFTSRDCGAEGSKGNWLEKPDPITGKRPLVGQRATGSKSKARKQASAEIAKIPPSLAIWIARVYKPKMP